jgi:hypothetical protein
MTGAYVRIERDGRWQNIELDQLTEAELGAFATAHPEDADKWLTFLVRWVRERVQGLTPRDLQALDTLDQDRLRLTAAAAGTPLQAESQQALWQAVGGLVKFMQALVMERPGEACDARDGL